MSLERNKNRVGTDAFVGPASLSEGEGRVPRVLGGEDLLARGPQRGTRGYL